MKILSQIRFVIVTVLIMVFSTQISANTHDNEHTVEMPNYKLVQSYLDSISGQKGPYWVFACMPSQLRYTIVIPYGKNKGVLIIYLLGEILRANTLAYVASTASWKVGRLPGYQSFYVQDESDQQTWASDKEVQADISKIMANYPRFYLMDKTSVSALLNVVQDAPHMKSLDCPGL